MADVTREGGTCEAVWRDPDEGAWEDGLSAAFEEAEIGLALLTTDGRFVRVNRVFCEMLGRPFAAIVGSRFSDLTPEHDQILAVTASFQRFVANPAMRAVERRFVHADGSTVWALVRATAIADDSGDPTGYVLQIRDNAERRQLEKDLRDTSGRLHDSQERCRMMLERLPVVSYRIELNGREHRSRYVTAGIEQLTGIPVGEWSADPQIWSRVIHPDDERAVLQTWERLLDGAGERCSMDYRMVRRDGSVVWVRDEAWSVRWRGHRHIEGMFLDISAQREAESAFLRQAEQLAEANARLLELDQRRTEFFVTTSHELRTPVTSVLGFAATLAQRWDEIEDPERQEFVSGIERQSRRLLRLLEELLTITRFEVEGVETRLAPIEVEPAILRSVAWFEAEEVEIEVRVPAGLRILTDPDRFHEIMSNLLANATRYGAPPITIDAYREHGSVIVRVIDRGPGVPADLLSTLFRRFARSEEQESRIQQGLGLGLAISRELARALGGNLWYEPASPHGASFSLRLPEASAFPPDDA